MSKIQLAEKGVKVFTMNYCPYCERAKSLLKKRGVAFEEILIEEEDDASWDALYQLSKMRTMPQVFFGKKLIGGFNELAQADAADQLAGLK